MKRGRPTKPTVLKKLEGTARADRVNPNEVRPDVSIPPCPKHLTGDARKEYRRITKELKKYGLITRLDLAAIAAYSQAYGRWMQAEKDFADEKKGKSQLVIITKGGYPMQNPYISVANKQIEIMHKFLAEFGFTPSARARLHVKPAEREEEQDPFTSFANRKKAVND